MRSFALLLSISLLVGLTACAPSKVETSPEAVTHASTPTVLPPETAIPLAFQQSDPLIRRAEVLASVANFLNDPDIQQLSDEEASARLTELAFSSQRLTLTDPAIVRRHETLAVVGLPDGLGLYLSDLSQSNHSVEISTWTVGLTSLNTVWRSGETGVIYETLSEDRVTTTHFALLHEQTDDWALAWFSDDEPEWWFNARNASLEVAPDLSTVTVIGESEAKPLIFVEDSGDPRRRFRVVWERIEEDDVITYRSQTPSSAYPTREEWMWAIAVPSPYASLVEFIERLQREDTEGALEIAINQQVMEDAQAFGFYLIDRPYDVILSEPERLIIRGRQGTFEIQFHAPRDADNPWQITRITPTGTQ